MIVELTVLPRIKWGARKKEQTEDNSLFAAIDEVKQELALANARFQMEDDLEMIEANIYEIRALERRLDCLMHRAKQAGLRKARLPMLVYDKVFDRS